MKLFLNNFITKKVKEKTFLEKAIGGVPGFKEINGKLERKVKRNSPSQSTYYNYARSIAKISLHFKQTPLEPRFCLSTSDSDLRSLIYFLIVLREILSSLASCLSDFP